MNGPEVQKIRIY